MRLLVIGVLAVILSALLTIALLTGYQRNRSRTATRSADWYQSARVEGRGTADWYQTVEPVVYRVSSKTGRV